MPTWTRLRAALSERRRDWQQIVLNSIRRANWRLVPRTWAWLVALVTLMGVVPTVLAYRTKLIVEVGQRLTNREALSTAFRVTNEGMLAIRQLRITCYMDTLYYSPRALRVEHVDVGEVFRLKRLEVDDPATFGCWNTRSGYEQPWPMFMGVPFTSGRLTLGLTYRTFGIPWDQASMATHRKTAAWRGSPCLPQSD